MPPPKSSRMTANPVKPSRYRPGKPIAEDQDSSSGEEEAEADDGEASDPIAKDNAAPPRQPPPKASSFPSNAAKKVTSNLRNVDLNQRQRQAEAEEKAKKAREWRDRQRQEQEAGFVTESESASSSEDDEEADEPPARQKQPTDQRPPRTAGSSSSSEASGSSEEDSGSDSSDSSAAAPRKHLRPVFIPKNQRNKQGAASTAEAAEAAAAAKAEAEAARRAAETDALVQERLERDAIARAAGKKSWDDDSPDEEEEVDDTDGVDPELERAQWVARELGRLKRARAALEEREAEIAEVERRKALSTPEREAEDRARIEKQAEERKGKAKAGFMQRYHHKGAFYHDEDSEDKGLLQRDLMGATYESGHGMKEALPQFLQARDETMIGRKGRTKYRDLKSEDTGRWGDFHKDRRGGTMGGSSYTTDDRFRPDYDAKGPSGANASALGDRKRAHDESSRSDGAKRPRRDDVPIS